MTVVETPWFLRDAASALTEPERQELVAFLAAALPLFLLNVFARNDKANLSKAERNELRLLAPRLVADCQRRLPK